MANQTLLLSRRIIPQPTITLSSPRSQVPDESIIREQVLSTHNYDGRKFNTNVILSIAENILSVKMGIGEEAGVEKLNQLEELINYENLPSHIRQLSFEIASAGLNSSLNNEHSTTIHILRMLCSYDWEDKMVLILAAFSINIIYGQLYCSGHGNIIRQAMAQKLELHLNQKPVVDCISCVLRLTKCVVELKQTMPSSNYSTPQSIISALPIATYRIGRSVVATSYSPPPNDELIEELTTSTATILHTFSSELEKKRAEESYEALKRALYYNSSSKSEVFRLMFNVKDGEMLFEDKGLNDWNSTRLVLLITQGHHISELRIQFLNFFARHANTRLLWIPIAQNNDASWTTEDEQQFKKLSSKTRFYWLNDPQKMISPQFIRFVKEQLFPYFQMGGEPIIVSLDQQGRIVHPNIMHMIQIWAYKYIEENTLGVQGIYNITALVEKELKKGTSSINREIPEIKDMISVLVGDINQKIVAWTQDIEKRIQNLREQSTPYDKEREKFLWQQEPNCSLDLVVGRYGRNVHLDYVMQNWFDREDYIFLYGGNDINWVREFTSKLHRLASKIQLKVELAYVGKNKMIRSIIDKENMSYCALKSSYSIWRFWTRLQSMFLSRIYYLDEINHFGEECNDEILHGLKKLLAYEGKNTIIEGWAVLSKGKKMVVCGHGAKILQVINDYEIWKENIATKGFDEAFKDHHEMLTSSSSSLKRHSCCALEYSTTLNKIPENEKCSECSYRMHKFVTFTCCHGHDIDSDED
ncbi:PREDICTED: protein SIEVE ELEMENT OCCLUSION B-like isoform X1 [Ipomoea nil]|uniref:protein SIEVE ELEMENT OCCLUSION B-like isoform X1 n=1 Tax=Ipomoea nil TaxID=35883 RepID=UPI000900B4F5|nr:PREDICTED: protein SIEVE ELEMENT OCCLUSION B-like isoform X1 [Ipomoea nil]